jgi:hypothetical protein
MTKLLNPKSLGAFVALGGISGLERGLGTHLSRGITMGEHELDGSVTSGEAAGSTEESPLYVSAKQFHRFLKRRMAQSRHSPAMRRPRAPGGRLLTEDEVADTEVNARDVDAGPFEDRERIFRDMRPPRRYAMDFLQLIRTANNNKALMLLTALSVFALALHYFEPVQPHLGVKQARSQYDREVMKPTYGTISDLIDVSTTPTIDPPWMRVAPSAHCPADLMLEALATSTTENAIATFFFCISSLTIALNLNKIAQAIVVHGQSILTQSWTSHHGNISASRVKLLLRAVYASLASSLIMQCMIDFAPGAAAAPVPIPTPSGPDFDGQQRLAWHYVRPWIPYAIGFGAIVYLLALYNTAMFAGGSKYPKMTANAAVAAAFVWFIARTSDQNTGESWEPITLTFYLSLWVVFMGDSIRSLDFKVDYVSYIVFGGGAACLPITFLFGPRSWAEYWHHYANAGPFILIATSILVYKCWPWRLQDRMASGSSEVQATAHDLAERSDFLGAQEGVQRRPPQNLHDRAGFQLVTPGPYSGQHED